MVLIVIGAALLIALIFGPQFLVRYTMSKHAAERPDMPGTGGEFAQHLIEEMGLADVVVEKTDKGDHYSPADKAVRLSAGNFDGRSITAAAVAAHEVGHALQHRDGYGPLMLRQKLAAHAIVIERLGGIVLMATPIVFMLIRAPSVSIAQLVAGLAILASTVAIHLVTLPTEYDASFGRALPILERYLPKDDMPAAHSVLKAAAFTYVAAALVSLIDVARWIRILRF